MTTTTDPVYIARGRCRSGKRWFWLAAECYADTPHKCDDPVCVYGGPHEYGWEDTEEAALAALHAAVVRLGGEREAAGSGRAGTAAAALKRINSRKRAARLPSPNASAAVVKYLYVPSTYTPYDDYLAETRRWVEAVPMVRKTAKRIYYSVGDRQDDVVTLGFIDRVKFERDGKIRIPGSHWRFRGLWFFATLESAEADLREGTREPAPTDLRDLRLAMADVHPDRGGTSEAFIAARERYERAMRITS